jgi:asparagine synthase (glutamine-hydrolysing)
MEYRKKKGSAGFLTMCGICGIFDFKNNPISRDLLENMNTQIRHRGPDGEGTYFAPGLGMANRRLSIIDIEGGTQPICNEDGTINVVYNGEIYNFVELREELRKNGHVFRTQSDTEVIVHGYEEWGDDCTNRFNGIFAFALWDCNRRRLLLARDHLGVKPLYYTVLGDRLLFASEIKALLRDPACPRAVNLQSLSLLFTLRYVPSPQTLFEGIQKLPPGHRMIVQSGGVQIERFWKSLPKIERGISETDLVQQYQALVEDAVRIQMRSDVPVGLFLSSGVDSGCLLALMSKLSAQPVHTFTIGFADGEESNETCDARTLANMFGSDHSELIVSCKDYEKYYERYLWDLEEPVGNETAAAFYFVSRMASEKVKVALTGQGADEPWAGYGRYLGVKLSEMYSRFPQSLTKGLFRSVGERWVRHEQWKRGLTSLYERDMLSRLVNVYSFFTPTMKAQLFLPWLKQQISCDGLEAADSLRSLQYEVRDLDPLTQILYMDTRSNLPDDLLMVGDKTSMANSLEVRVPFLDYRLIEFIETLPPNLKLKGFRAKYLHKKAIEKWLPRQIVHRKKKGFANPIDKWLRSSMRPFVNDCLLSETAAVNRYFDRGYIRRMLERHEQNEAQHLRHIYLLLSFELWHRQFISA